MEPKRGDASPQCLELVKHCRAMCCRMGGTMLTPDEIASGEYETEAFCLKKKELCDKDIECYHRIIQCRTQSLVCIYLGEDDRCGIYERRPEVCAGFSCGFGGPDRRKKTIYGERDMMRLSAGMSFSLNPSVRLKAVIAEPGRDRIFLLYRDRELCADSMASIPPPWPGATDEQIVDVFLMFGGGKRLGEAEEQAKARLASVTDDASTGARRLVVACLREKLLLPCHC